MDRVRDLVAAGGVSVVLAQDRDRLSREPAYTYLLRREFEEHGTKIRALNFRGDESPEGDLTDGILETSSPNTSGLRRERGAVEVSLRRHGKGKSSPSTPPTTASDSTRAGTTMWWTK
jgi:hypothetical protein